MISSFWTCWVLRFFPFFSVNEDTTELSLDQKKGFIKAIKSLLQSVRMIQSALAYTGKHIDYTEVK